MAETMLMQAKGINGTLELWPDHLCILHVECAAELYRHSECSLLALRDIYSIEFHEVPTGLIGYISFNGGTDEDGIADYCMSFLKNQESAFQAIRDRINQHRAALSDCPWFTLQPALARQEEQPAYPY